MSGGRRRIILLLTLPLLLLLLHTKLVDSHYFPSTPSAPHQSEWKYARATYYASADPQDTVGGACGYGDLDKNGYGKATAALSTVLFEKGQICGACFELRCVEDLRWCIPGTSIIVTATNFCAPNYGFGADGGGKCNPPNTHFVLPIEAFEKIAIWKASNMPVQYRRIGCRKEGGMRFTIGGAGIFFSVLISNVAGGGDVAAVKIKGSRTGWLPMGRNWGQNWHINADLKNQPLSFEITSGDGITITSYSVAPKNWEFGRSFEGARAIKHTEMRDRVSRTDAISFDHTYASHRSTETENVTQVRQLLTALARSRESRSGFFEILTFLSVN